MTWSDDAVELIAPWYTVDYETYVRAFMAMTAQVQTYADDVTDADGNLVTPGWSTMLDVDTAPYAGLPYLAQWVGERPPAGLSDADLRQWIRDAPNQWRGTPYSVARATQRWLTGAKLVQIRERSKLDGTVDVDWIAVQTFTSMTPNVDLVKHELRKVIPADLMLDFATVDGASWADIDAAYDSWDDMFAALPTWADVAGSTPGFISWS